jgi:hypothetical protein
MKKFLMPFMALLLSATLINASFAADNKSLDKRLLGKWRSDKVRNLELLSERQCLNEQEKAFWEEKFGHLTYEITGQKVIVSWEGDESLRGESPLNIIWADEDTTVLYYDVPGEKRKSIQIIKIENDDSIYMLSVQYERREYFKRVK